MISTLTLQCAGWDTALIGPGRPSLFFADSTNGGAFTSIVSRDEHWLMDSLLSDRSANPLLMQAVGAPAGALWASRVREPFVHGDQKPGDIDVMIASTAEPGRAIVGEAKWVKVRADDGGGQRVNKLDAATGAEHQVAGLLALGFSQAYLVLLTVVEDRSDAGLNFAFRGANTATLRRLIEFTETVRLPAEAGILYVEVSQPLTKDLGEAGFVCAGVLRMAAVREMTGDLSSKVSSFLSERGRHF